MKGMEERTVESSILCGHCEARIRATFRMKFGEPAVKSGPTTLTVPISFGIAVDHRCSGVRMEDGRPLAQTTTCPACGCDVIPDYLFNPDEKSWTFVLAHDCRS